MLQVTEELRAVEEILLLILDTDNGEISPPVPPALPRRCLCRGGADGPGAGKPHRHQR